MSDAIQTSSGGTGGAASSAAPQVDAGAALAALGIETNGDGEASGDDTATLGGTGGDGAGEVGEGAESAASDASAAGAATDPQATKAARREAWKALFSDEALASPEGVKAARDALRAREVKHSDNYQRTVKREQEAKSTVAQARQAAQNYTSLNGQLQSLLTTVREGTPEQALHAIGMLRGKAGIDAYEELTSTVIGLKKNPPPADSPKLIALEAELRNMKQAQADHATQADNARWAQGVAQQAAAMTAEGAPVNPGIAFMIKAGNTTLRAIVDAVAEEKIAYHQRTGQVLPDANIIAQLEKIWRPLVPNAAPPATGVARLTGRMPGQGTTRTGSAPGSRELTEAERDAEIANDPGFLRQLGLA